MLYEPVWIGLGIIPDFHAPALSVVLVLSVTGPLYKVELSVGVLPSIV